MFLQERLLKKKEEKARRQGGGAKHGARSARSSPPRASRRAGGTVIDSASLVPPQKLAAALELAKQTVVPEGGVMVIVDPLSTGVALAREFQKRGVMLARVFSRSFPPSMLAHGADAEGISWESTVQHSSGDVKRTAKLLQQAGLPLIGCIAGSEMGVELAECLAEELRLRGNCSVTSQQRRNKYLMQECLRGAGVRAVRQMQAGKRDWRRVCAFVEQDLKPDPFEVVIKPVDSAGSDGVHLCRSLEQLKLRFDELCDAVNVMGAVNDKVLVQEYLRGPEYVVDTVSLHGVHKVVAVWQYDKRPANGVFNVYYGLQQLHADDAPVPALLAYTHKVLDALALRHGPGHAEIIMCKDGPCLVEVGARPHGGDGTWLELPKQSMGYTQLSACVDTFVAPERFLSLPGAPRPCKFGHELYLVSTATGVVRAMPRVRELEATPSFVSFHSRVEVGADIAPTVDRVMTPGSVLLLAESAEALARDVKRVREICDSAGFFVLDAGLPPVPAGLLPSSLRHFTGSQHSLARSFAGSLARSLGKTPRHATPAPLASSLRDHPQLMHPRPTVVMTPASVETLISTSLSVRAGGSSVGLAAMGAMASTRAVVVVDPLSTGATLAAELYGSRAARGNPPVTVIRVFSHHFPAKTTNFLPPGLEVEFAATVQHDGDVKVTLKLLEALPYDIIAVVPGHELGVELADELAEVWRLRCNGSALSAARRDKYLMGEQVRQCGTRAAKQLRVKHWEEVEEFVTRNLKPDPFKVIIKPTASAGSDGVFKCTTMEQLHGHFDELIGELDHLGQLNHDLLVQEFLDGPEYVVDTVSKDGVHKCVAVWQYDKRAIHGKHNVYFGMRLVSADGPKARQLVPYVNDVITALNIANGGAHTEVIFTPTGPCLVESGARVMGAAGTWTAIAEQCLGYTSVSVWADLILNPSRFDAVPAAPLLNKGKHGHLVFLVCREAGVLAGFSDEVMAQIKGLPSFVDMHLLRAPGDELPLTTDAVTIPGLVVLVHEDPAVLDADQATVHSLERQLLLMEGQSKVRRRGSPQGAKQADALEKGGGGVQEDDEEEEEEDAAGAADQLFDLEA